MKNKKMFKLKEIIYELYREKGLEINSSNCLDNKEKYSPEFESFYCQKNKEFKDIIRTVDLEEEFEQIKISGEFCFTNTDKSFIKELLNEYTGKLQPLRRADYIGADSLFVFKLHDGFIDIFKNAGVNDNVLLVVDNKINNRIKYPIKKAENYISNINSSIKDLISNVYGENDPQMTYLNRNDKFIWLAHMADDFKLFYDKWSAILEYMAITRYEETEEIIKAYIKSLNPEELNNFYKNEKILSESTKILAQNKFYKNLNTEINRLLKIEPLLEFYTPYHKSVNDEKSLKSNKQPFVSKIEKEYCKLVDKIEDIKNAVYNEVSNSLYNCDYKPNDLSKITLDEIASSDEILENAKEDYYYELKMDEISEKNPKLSKETKEKLDKKFKINFNIVEDND